MSQLPASPKFHSVSLRPAIFELQAILRQVHRMTPKWPWTLKGKRYPIYMIQIPSSPKFHSILLYGQAFLGYMPFSDKYTQWPQMVLNTKSSKVPHIHVTSTHGSQISITFALRQAVFESQAILIQVHRMTPKWNWTLKGQRYPVYMLQLPPSPNFHSVSLYG